MHHAYIASSKEYTMNRIHNKKCHWYIKTAHIISAFIIIIQGHKHAHVKLTCNTINPIFTILLRKILPGDLSVIQFQVFFEGWRMSWCFSNQFIFHHYIISCVPHTCVYRYWAKPMLPQQLLLFILPCQARQYRVSGQERNREWLADLLWIVSWVFSFPISHSFWNTIAATSQTFLSEH